MGNARNFAFWIVLFFLMIVLFTLFNNGSSTTTGRTVAYSDFLQRVDAGDVSRVVIDGETLRVTDRGGQVYTTIRPGGENPTDRLIAAHVSVEARPQERSGLMSAISVWLPFLLLIGVWVFFMNRMQGGGRGGAMGFGKSKAKLLTEKHGRVTFDDVAGIDEAKDELEEIV
ncbi:MAG: ATP-dependent metallopeptidase FtsH/Yme1/Tma family protein, partial [Rhodobacteraceae bacterium]|nr:ATP-dependent metallopeptidase FtsH/Yme1/Tma family protein [Paracoccaceae bacterium]